MNPFAIVKIIIGLSRFSVVSVQAEKTQNNLGL